MKKALGVIFLALASLSGAFAQVTTPPDTRLAAWKPHFENDNELFPSVVLAMSGRKFNARPDSHLLGDPVGWQARLSAPPSRTHTPTW